MNVIALIPARAGSRGFPGKNTSLIAGKPMILHTVDAAQRCRYINEVWVSTNSLGVAREVAATGVHVHERPDGLGTAATTMREVVQDFASTPGRKPDDVIVVLYPTYPTRTAQHLDAILSAYEGKPMIGLKRAATHPYLCVTADDDGRPSRLIAHQLYRRQDYPDCYELTHAACVLPMWAIPGVDEQLLHPATIAFWVPAEWDLVDVDSPADAERAERILAG